MRYERELAALGRSLRRQAESAKALFVLANALRLPAGKLIAYQQKDFESSLRSVSVSVLGELVHALSATERRSRRADRASAASLDGFVRFILAEDARGSKLELVERAIVAEALSASGGNQSAAARLLGVNRKALVRRLAKYRPEGRKVRRRPRGGRG